MPMIQTFDWETVHSWNSNRWNNGEWTNEKMQDELEELDKFRKTNLPSYSLVRLVNTIIEDSSIQKGNIVYDFSRLKEIFGTWVHLTTTCKNYGRVWVAQDESYLACLEDEKRKCNHFNTECKDYEPMVKGKSLEELAKEEKVEFT